MTDPKDQINPLKNSEDYEKLKASYEAKIQAKAAEVEEWKNTAIKSDEECLAKTEVIEKLTEDRDYWKKEVHKSRRIEQAKQETKQGNEFMDLLTAKLDQQIQTKQTK